MRSSSKSRNRGRNANRRGNNGGSVINRVFESAGPEGKVRGTPQQIIDKYISLAHDSQLSGDRVSAENFQQHAEHYSRILSEAQKELIEKQVDVTHSGSNNFSKNENLSSNNLNSSDFNDVSKTEQTRKADNKILNVNIKTKSSQEFLPLDNSVKKSNKSISGSDKDKLLSDNKEDGNQNISEF